MNFPDKCLLNILRRLSLIDRLMMRRVSKKFRALIDLEPITELVFCTNYRLNFFHRWWYTWQEIDPKQHFCTLFDLSADTSILKHLKKLKIRDDLTHVDLLRLQRFTELEMLEVGRLFFSESDETVHFPNLKVLYVEQIVRQNDKGTYTFNSINLSAAFFGDSSINYIIPVKRDSVEHLEFGNDLMSHKDSLKFVNVKVMKVNNALELDMHILGKLIVELPYLEELHLNVYPFNDLCTNVSFANVSRLRSRLRVMHDLSLNQKKHRESKKSKSKIDIYLQGVLIQANLPGPEIFAFHRLLLFHHKYGSRLCIRLPTVCGIDYLDVARLASGSMPDIFLKKYPHIEFVEATRAIEPYPYQFLDFIANLTRVMALSIRSADFGQEFYNQLPKVSSLRSLTMMIVLDENPIDFSWIKSFELLNTFKTNLLPANVVLDLLEHLNVHGDYEFCFQNGNRAVILKQKPNRYILMLYQRRRTAKLAGNVRPPVGSSPPSPENLTEPPGNALFDESLDCYSKKIYDNLTLEKVAAKFYKKKNLLRHWFDQSEDSQSP